MKTLLIVDVQNDFLSGGSLAVPKAEEVIPVINQLMGYFDLVLATKDWHPAESNHFEKWPAHCVAETTGADFPSNLDQDNIDQVFYKGTGKMDDGYSAFEATNISIQQFLKERKINEIYLCGIALEFCVKYSALDALKEGFEVFLLRDAIATISTKQEEIEQHYSELKEAGARIHLSSEFK